MNYKMLKLQLDEDGHKHDIFFLNNDNEVKEEFKKNDGQFVLHNLSDHHNYIILRCQCCMDCMKKQILDNGNYEHDWEWAAENFVVFINKKIKKDGLFVNCGLYVNYLDSGIIFDEIAQRHCKINEIVCPCIIKSYNDIIPCERFANLKLELISGDRHYIYFATKREIMTKSIQIKNR